MGKSTIKQLAETVQITDSTTLYRIGNLRILRINGTTPHNNILATEDWPKESITAAGDASNSSGNLYSCLGRVTISSTGVITTTYLTAYYAPNTGYSPLLAPSVIHATAIWTV